MSLLEAIRVALALRRLVRAGRRVVLYESHCGAGWVATVDGRPAYAETASAALRAHLRRRPVLS